METPKEAFLKYPFVPAETLSAWYAKFPEGLTGAALEEIEPQFFYTVSTPARPGDNPREIYRGRFEVGDFWEIAEAEEAAQILYFQNREARITLCEASE